MNMNETPTPETDAHLDIYAYPEEAVHQNWADFARQLERRLTIARENLEQAVDWPDSCRDFEGDCTDLRAALTLTAPKQ